ncbi:MAG: hypothetical protein ACM3SW_04670 [Actinomycetota bacterium]
MLKFTRKGLLALLVTGVLGAGTVSALQLRTNATGFAACRGSCTSSTQCATGCICAFPLESTTGFCSSHPTGVVTRAH